MCPTLNISGKCPISKKLLNILYRGKEIGVANKAMNFPGTPQCDELDFFISHIISYITYHKGLIVRFFPVSVSLSYPVGKQIL